MFNKLKNWLTDDMPTPNGLKSEDLRDLPPNMTDREVGDFFSEVLADGGQIYPSQMQYETGDDLRKRNGLSRSRQELVTYLNRNPNFPYRAE